LQQFARFSGALGGQFAPQQAGVEHAFAVGILELSGNSRAIRIVARRRTGTTLT
jgi:hypothetical protein